MVLLDVLAEDETALAGFQSLIVRSDDPLRMYWPAPELYVRA